MTKPNELYKMVPKLLEHHFAHEKKKLQKQHSTCNFEDYLQHPMYCSQYEGDPFQNFKKVHPNSKYLINSCFTEVTVILESPPGHINNVSTRNSTNNQLAAVTYL